ncbi:MAG TPA: hypothetical protein GX699_04370 [Firmicutes bacterium]|nr:hypothetical protein [Bacillota bacterium]
MSKQAVLSVMLIFLFALALVWAGLTQSERVLQEISGTAQGAAALAVSRDAGGGWILTFAGRSFPLNGRIWQVLNPVSGRRE